MQIKIIGFLRKIYYFLWLARLTIVIPIFLVGICSFYICNLSLNNIPDIILILIPGFLAACGFILNDILDVEKDKINCPQRPLPSKLISPKSAKMVFFIIAFLTLLLILSTNSILIIAMFLVGFVLTLAYSMINKFNGVLGNLLTAILSTIPWLIPAIHLNQINVIIVPTFACFCLIFSREILLDIKDIKGDQLQGFSTLPIKLGITSASLISFTIMCLLNLTIFLYGIQNNYNLLFYGLTILGFTVPLIIFFILLINNKISNYINYICNFGKIQFLIGIISFVVFR